MPILGAHFKGLAERLPVEAVLLSSTATGAPAFDPALDGDGPKGNSRRSESGCLVACREGIFLVGRGTIHAWNRNVEHAEVNPKLGTVMDQMV